MRQKGENMWLGAKKLGAAPQNRVRPASCQRSGVLGARDLELDLSLLLSPSPPLPAGTEPALPLPRPSVGQPAEGRLGVGKRVDQSTPAPLSCELGATLASSVQS